MNFDTTLPARHTRRLSMCSVAWAGLLLAACGGQDDATTATANGAAAKAENTATAASAANVRLEGCVVDALWLSAPGVAVHVRTAEGRTVGAAFTNARGVFEISVPAHAALVVDTGTGMQDHMPLMTGSGPVTVAGCLMTGS